MRTLFFILSFGLIFFSCSTTEKGPMHYPDHWWASLEESKRYEWEIPPQAADRSKGEVILSKRNELGLLSNFSSTPFIFRGKRYASLEGFWQMMKYPEGPSDPRAIGRDWRLTRDQVAELTAFEAHAAGVEAEKHMKDLGIDWISFEGKRMRFKKDPNDIEAHYKLIEEATKAKIEQNFEVKRVLLATAGLTLRPDHHEDKDGTKSWQYYKIYERLRDQWLLKKDQ